MRGGRSETGSMSLKKLHTYGAIANGATSSLRPDIHVRKTGSLKVWLVYRWIK
jgi:hypothetical protein